MTILPRLPTLATTFRRGLSTTAPRARIFDDFKNILDDSPRPAIQVESLTPEEGFRFADGLIVPSACVFVNHTLFLWDAPEPPTDLRWEGWQEKHFSIFEVVRPKPEILLLGTGDRPIPPSPALRKYINGLGLQVDSLSSWNACSTYNLLAEEGRRVAAAVLPLNYVPARATKASADQLDPNVQLPLPSDANEKSR